MNTIPLLLIALIAAGLNTQSHITELMVVTDESRIIWTGTKIMGYHQGTVQIREGKLLMNNQRLAGGSFIIDLSTINCTDIPASDPIPKRNLENHLKDPDFFDTKRFPTASFTFTEISPDAENQAKYQAYGNLTIKGITRKIKIEVEVASQSDKIFIGQTDMRFNRQLWGVAYSGLKDELVHDEIKLKVFVKAEGSGQQINL